jgi:hypothetical protein
MGAPSQTLHYLFKLQKQSDNKKKVMKKINVLNL